MGTKSKSLTLVLIPILAFSSLILDYSAFAQTGSSGNVASFTILDSSKGSNIHAIGLLIFAYDINHNTASTFTGSVYFTSNVGTVSPASSGHFSRGFWSGILNVNGVTPAIVGPTNQITISINDGNGHTSSKSISITSYDDLPSPTITPAPTSSLTPLPSLSPTPITTLTPSPSIPESPSWTILLLLTIMVASAGLLVYHKKNKHNSEKKV
jgi:hypothetical protein